MIIAGAGSRRRLAWMGRRAGGALTGALVHILLEIFDPLRNDAVAHWPRTGVRVLVVALITVGLMGLLQAKVRPLLMRPFLGAAILCLVLDTVAALFVPTFTTGLIYTF